MEITIENIGSIYKSLPQEQKNEFLTTIDLSESDFYLTLKDLEKNPNGENESFVWLFVDVMKEVYAKAPKTETKPEPKQEPKEEPKKETETAVEKEVKEVKTEKEEKEKPKKAKSVDVSDWEEEIEKVKAEKEKAKAEKAKKPKKVVIDDDFSELDEIDKEVKGEESVEDDFSELDAIDEVKTKRRGRPRKEKEEKKTPKEVRKVEYATEKIVEKVVEKTSGKERKAVARFLKVMSDELAKLSAVFADSSKED